MTKVPLMGRRAPTMGQYETGWGGFERALSRKVGWVPSGVDRYSSMQMTMKRCGYLFPSPIPRTPWLTSRPSSCGNRFRVVGSLRPS